MLYLPALALATVSNFSMRTSILIMGVICIAMASAGGIEAVVWTDVAQTVILLAGALVTLLVIVGGIPGGAADAWPRSRPRTTKASARCAGTPA